MLNRLVAPKAVKGTDVPLNPTLRPTTRDKAAIFVGRNPIFIGYVTGQAVTIAFLIVIRVLS